MVTDQRRRFVVNKGHAEEIEPLIPWQNLTYIGGFNVGTTICGVSELSLFVFASLVYRSSCLPNCYNALSYFASGQCSAVGHN